MKQKTVLHRQLFDISSSPFAKNLMGGKLHRQNAVKQDKNQD